MALLETAVQKTAEEVVKEAGKHLTAAAITGVVVDAAITFGVGALCVYLYNEYKKEQEAESASYR